MAAGSNCIEVGRSADFSPLLFSVGRPMYASERFSVGQNIISQKYISD